MEIIPSKKANPVTEKQERRRWGRRRTVQWGLHYLIFSQVVTGRINTGHAKSK